MTAGCSSSHSLVPGPHPCYHGPQPSQPSCNCQSPGADVVYITWDLTPCSQQPAQPARGSNTENRDRNGRPVCLKSADPTMVLESNLDTCISFNQLEKLEAARSAYLRLPFLTLPFFTFPALPYALPFLTKPYLS